MAESAPTLVDRVGGVAAMRALLREFYERLRDDPLVGLHFAGRDLDRIVEGQLGFLRKAFGDVAEFSGRHPSVAHRALAPILRGQFDRRLVILEQVLAEHGVAPDDRTRWIGVERSMRRVIEAPPGTGRRGRS